MIDQVQFQVFGLARHGNGSFTFQVMILLPSPIAGAPPEVIGTAQAHVNNDKVCAAMGSAFANIAQQLPPELAIAQ
jgi:hypothetical protein